MSNSWTPEEFANYVYQKDRTDPEVKVTGFTIKLSFNGYTRVAKMMKDGTVQITDVAKRGKCLAVEQGKKESR